MRSPFRSSVAMFCRCTLQAGGLLLVAAGCNSWSLHSLPQDKPSDDNPGATSWTVKRPRAHAADSGVPVAHDAGPSLPEPKPAADSGTIVQDAGTESPEMEPAPTASILLSGGPVTSEPAPTTNSFSLSSVPDLYVYTTWSNLSGEHTELRKYYDPAGELFYQKLTAFSTDISEPVPFTRKVAVPHNTSVLPAIANAEGAFVMQDYIGLAGSWIGDHSMTGTWRVDLYLDNATSPSATRSFELTP